MGVEELFRAGEGFRKNIYLDTKGNRTVGTGLNVDDPVTASFLPAEVVSGERAITPEEDTAAVKARLDLGTNDARGFIGANVFDSLEQGQRDGLVDMATNMGLSPDGKTKFNSFERLKAALGRGDFQAAHDEVLDSGYAKDVGDRAKRNAMLIRGSQGALESDLLRQLA